MINTRPCMCKRKKRQHRVMCCTYSSSYTSCRKSVFFFNTFHRCNHYFGRLTIGLWQYVHPRQFECLDFNVNYAILSYGFIEMLKNYVKLSRKIKCIERQTPPYYPYKAQNARKKSVDICRRLFCLCALVYFQCRYVDVSYHRHNHTKLKTNDCNFLIDQRQLPC